MKKQLILFLATVMVITFACQKELSFESPNTISNGSLKDDASGDCLPQTVNGAYIAGTALVPATNTIVVQVDVAQTGTYTIYTDTVNGYYFRTTGVFTNTGLTNVTLRSNGTPFAAGINNFVVTYDTSVCNIAVTVMPAGTGPAAFTLVSGGTPTNCASAIVSGIYTQGVALIATNNYVDIMVNVTTVGTYSITASGGGMTFSKTGTFSATGNQAVRLDGAGTPTTTGDNTITFAAPFASCSFTVTVASGGPAVFTLVGSPSCTTPVINGTYTVGTALGASNTVVLNVNVTVAGTYNVTTSAVNGMTFSGSGVLATGNQTITLTGSGTPTTAGTNTIPVTAGASTCSFTINVTGPAVCTLNGSPGNCAGATINGIYVVGGTLTASHTVVLGVNVTTAGTYTVTTTTNGLTFSGSGTLALGPQNITLTASGSATTSGNNSFSVSVNGSPSCTFTIYVLANDYYPRTATSNWSYEWDDVPTDSVMRTATSNTISAAGNTWTIFMQNDGITPPPDSGGYYRRSADDYLEWFDFGTWIGYDNPLWVEYTLLKSAIAENTPWKSPPTGGWAGTAGGNNFNLRFSYKILTGQKNVPVSITTSGTPATVIYQDVIVVEERIEMEVGGIWQDITSQIDYYGKSYYARGIGLIKFEALNASNVVQAKMELRRWQVL